jgi:hypothetical protein
VLLLTFKCVRKEHFDLAYLFESVPDQMAKLILRPRRASSLNFVSFKVKVFGKLDKLNNVAKKTKCNERRQHLVTDLIVKTRLESGETDSRKGHEPLAYIAKLQIA